MPNWKAQSMLLDVSEYQLLTKEDFLAAKAEGVIGVIIRAGKGNYKIDSMLSRHVQAAYDAGLPAGIYWVHDPCVYINMGLNPNKPEDYPKLWEDPQIKYMIRALGTIANPTKIFYCMGIDCEITEDQFGKPIDPAHVLFTTRHFKDQIDDTYGRKYKSLLYSAPWYVMGKYPALEGWAKDQDLWWAQYAIHPQSVVSLESLQEWRDKYCVTEGWNPTLPYATQPGRLKIWQASGDRFTRTWHRGRTWDGQGNEVPGGPSALDINLLNMTQAEFYSWMGYTPSTPPIPPTPEPSDPPSPDTTQLDRIESKVNSMYDILKKIQEI